MDSKTLSIALSIKSAIAEIMDSGYGADSLRVYEMFIAPYDMDAPWDTRGVPGTYRFLNRTWNLVQEYLDGSEIVLNEQQSAEVLKIAHKTTKKVTPNRIIVPVFIYFKTLIFSFFDSCSAIKLVTPVDIPKSVNEVSIITKFTAAEKIPKSETDSDLATRSV